MANFYRLVLLISLLIFNNFVLADNFLYWNGDDPSIPQSPSPTAVCTSTALFYNSISTTNFTFKSVSGFENTACILSRIQADGAHISDYTSTLTFVKCIGTQIVNLTTRTCEAPPACIAGEGPTGYLATNSCLDGCTHVYSGQQAKIGDITYGSYLAKTGGSCTTSSGTPLMNKGDVDAAMKAADDKSLADAAAAKSAKDAKNASDKAAAASAAAQAKSDADASAKAEKASADAKAASDAAASKAASDAASGSSNASASAADAAAKAADAASKAADAAAKAASAAASAGGSAAAGLPDQPPEFCTLHPTSIICKNSSIVAGNCAGGHSTGFSCSGDAIQCQVAQQQVETECKLYAPSDEAELGKRLLAGTDSTDSLNPSQSANRTTIDLPNSLDEGSNIGGGEFNDFHVSLAGGGVTLPFSKLNFVMHILGAFILAGAYLNAARIVGVRG